MEQEAATWPHDAVRWSRSSFCATGACVEIASAGDVVGMRDGKDPQRVITFSRDFWHAFLDAIPAVQEDLAEVHAGGPVRSRAVRITYGSAKAVHAGEEYLTDLMLPVADEELAHRMG